MHFSPEILREQAQRLTNQIVDQNPDILAVYLRGSLVHGSPLIGGAGDVDLVLIRQVPPEVPREIIPLTPEIHFDLEHHDQSLYHDHRSLRTDPWLGPTLHESQPLYDPKHFFDYTQSGARSLFHTQETIQDRALPWLKQARQFWLDRQLSAPLGTLEEIQPYLTAVQQAVNSLALLSGPPLTIRRLGLTFPETAQQINPDLLPRFQEALGGHLISFDQLDRWLSSWIQALEAAGEHREGVLLSQQKRYFLDAVQVMLGSERPLSALWPLLNSWTAAVKVLPGDHQLRQEWREACGALGLAGNDFRERLETFDQLLEVCESSHENYFGEPEWS